MHFWNDMLTDDIEVDALLGKDAHPVPFIPEKPSHDGDAMPLNARDAAFASIFRAAAAYIDKKFGNG